VARRSACLGLCAALATALTSARPAAADDAATTSADDQARAAASERFKSGYLLGDWGGVRTDLWAAGFEPTLLLITDPYGNPTGGLKQGFDTYSLLCADLGIDTTRAAGWRGGRVDVGWSWNFGNQLSQDVVGNVFPIQSADVAPPGTRLTNLSFTQDLLDGAVSVRAGRFSIDALYGQEFAGSNYFRAFTSVAFNAIPFSLFYNAPGPFGYPATTWGARIKVQPSDALCLMGGIFNGDPEVDEADQHGLDFSLEGPPLAIAEIGLRSNQAPGATGLAGNLKFGGYTLGGDVQEYGSTEESSGRYGFYIVGDQMIMRFGGVGDGRHLGVFGSVVVAPDQSVSPMPYSAFGGLVAYGPMASRPRGFPVPGRGLRWLQQRPARGAAGAAAHGSIGPAATLRDGDRSVVWDPGAARPRAAAGHAGHRESRWKPRRRHRDRCWRERGDQVLSARHRRRVITAAVARAACRRSSGVRGWVVSWAVASMPSAGTA